MHRGGHGGWRLIAILPITTMGFSSIIATGGDGGDWRDILDDDATTMLPSYEYSIHALSGAARPLLVSLETAGGTAVVSIDLDNGLTGSVDTAFDGDGDLLLPNRTVLAGSSMNVAVNVSPFGSFDVIVTDDLGIEFDDPPGAGAIEVVSATETARVSFVTIGVQLGLGGAAPVFYTWDAFDRLLDDDGAPDWQRRASLAVSALELVQARAFDAAGVIETIRDNLPGTNPTTAMCDALTGSPPPGIAVRGMWTLTWLGSGSLRPGDDFRWELNDCWLNDPFSDSDELLDGGIDLLGYTEVITNDTVTRIGFEPFRTSDGGVIFDDFVVRGLTRDGLGNFTLDAGGAATLSGGFVVVLFAP